MKNLSTLVAGLGDPGAEVEAAEGVETLPSLMKPVVISVSAVIND